MIYSYDPEYTNLLVVIFFPLTNFVELDDDLTFIPPPIPPIELLNVWMLAPPPPKSSNPPPPPNIDMEVEEPPVFDDKHLI